MSDDLDLAHNSIFSGPALGIYENMDVKHSSEGVQLRVSCERCGRESHVEIDWGEIFCIMMGVFPQQVRAVSRRNDIFPTDFEYVPKRQCLTPVVDCMCSTRVIFPITPGECKQWFDRAQYSNLMTPQMKGWIAQLNQIVQSIKNPKPQQARQQPPRR